jgi:hypothetical protein
MHKLKKQQGSVTMVVIAAVMVLTIIGGMFFVLTTQNMQTSDAFQNRVTARYAAEGGARTAAAMLAATTPDWNALSLELEMSKSPGVYYKVTITPALTGTELPVPGTKYEIKSTGRHKRTANSVAVDAVIDEETLKVTLSSWR